VLCYLPNCYFPHRIVVGRRQVVEANHNQGANAYGKVVGGMPANIESSTPVTDAAFAERCALDTSSGKRIGRATGPTGLAHPREPVKVPRKTAAEMVYALDALLLHDWNVPRLSAVWHCCRATPT
jgi:hypothetical protein